MDLITNRVPCITFELATPESINFVTIVNGADCSSDLGMKGGAVHLPDVRDHESYDHDDDPGDDHDDDHNEKWGAAHVLTMAC